jgi:hypothetical protein
VVELVHAIEAAITAKRSFSVVRLGDGEGALLRWDDPNMREDIVLCLSIWFGQHSPHGNELDEIREGVRRAIRSADILGLPRRLQLNKTPRYRAVLPAVSEALDDATPMLTDAAFHFYLQWSGALARLLRGKERVRLITCRNISDDLKDALNVGAVDTVLIQSRRFLARSANRIGRTASTEFARRSTRSTPATSYSSAPGYWARSIAAGSSSAAGSRSTSAACSTIGRTCQAAAVNGTRSSASTTCARPVSATRRSTRPSPPSSQQLTFRTALTKDSSDNIAMRCCCVGLTQAPGIPVFGERG